MRRLCLRQASNSIQIDIYSRPPCIRQRRSNQWGNAMKLPRRTFLHLAAGAAALPAVSRIARAQAYPSRPVRIIVGFPAGGASDITRALDRPMAVGAARPAIRHREPARRRHQYRHRSGRACAARRLHAALWSTPTNAINATLYKKLNFNFIRDIAPVAGIIRVSRCHGGHSVVSGQDRSGIHCLCQGQSGQDQHGVARHRQPSTTWPANCSR